MEPTAFDRRLDAAVKASWATVGLGFLVHLFGYLAWLAMMYARPDWMLKLWGGTQAGLTWWDVQSTVLWFFGWFKIGLWMLILGSVWLTFWRCWIRRGREREGSEE